MAAPSPMFMPARPRSNGRHGSGSISWSALNPLKVRRASASVPPVSAASSRPVRMASAAWPIAMVLDEQAATTHERSPSKPKSPAMTSTGVLEKWFQTSDGRANFRAARVHHAVEVFVAQQIAGARAEQDADPRRRRSPPSSPASATASRAATTPN